MVPRPGTGVVVSVVPQSRQLVIEAQAIPGFMSAGTLPYFVNDSAGLANVSPGDAKLTRRFWFDRVGGIRLARVQTYDDRGLLVTDVSYHNERTLGSGPTASLPSRVEITRPQDQYKLSISYQDSGSVELNREYGPKTFVLENKWKLPEVDLDAQNRKVTANQ